LIFSAAKISFFTQKDKKSAQKFANSNFQTTNFTFAAVNE